MNTLIPINNVNVSFEIIGDEIFANSLQIAEVFEKDHSNVLKAVNKIPNNEFKNSNFKVGSYCDKKGEQRRMINITRDGFVMLVMGFTGDKAYRFKVEYINAFNKMQHLLKNKELESGNKLISNLERRNKRVALGYKSQLAQQKEKYELQIKSLKCELEHGQKIDFKKGIDKDLKRQLAERGYLLMNLADFHSLGEGLAARMFEGLGQIFGKHYPPCLKQLPILHFYGATDYYNVKIHNNLGNTPQRAWGVNVGVLNAKLKPVDKIYSPIYNKWVIEDGEQIAGWELELRWKGDKKLSYGS